MTDTFLEVSEKWSEFPWSQKSAFETFYPLLFSGTSVVARSQVDDFSVKLYISGEQTTVS